MGRSCCQKGSNSIVGQDRRVCRQSASRKVHATRAEHVRTLLPKLYQHTEGKPFGSQHLLACLKSCLNVKLQLLPSAQSASRLLKQLAICPGASRTTNGNGIHVWEASGPRYIDDEGPQSINNVEGCRIGPGAFKGRPSWVSWHEYGSMYHIQEMEPSESAQFRVVHQKAFKTVGVMESRRHVGGSTGEASLSFKNTLVFNPWCHETGQMKPEWSLIYLHSFSSKGIEYRDLPHYFAISAAAVRVVLPTAPLQEQTCFNEWHVWQRNQLKWQRIKFNSWFDYLTDNGGLSENGLDLQSLLNVRTRIHALIRKEVENMGGDAKRVIIGGASQGCCVALDAAMTYPEELAGVIGIVGHLLGATALDPAKRTMPVYLFHEATDKEMNWQWVKGTVQRLIDEGFMVISKREHDPSGCGHWVQDIEGVWLRRALRRITSNADR